MSLIFLVRGASIESIFYHARIRGELLLIMSLKHQNNYKKMHS